MELREKKTRDGWLGSLSAFSSRLRWHCHFIQKFEVDCTYETDFINKGFNSLKRNTNIKYIKAWKKVRQDIH